jgi:hypothetical protein
MDESKTAAIVEATKLAKPVVEAGLDLFESLVGNPCRIAGGMLSDHIYAWRLMNRIRILDRVAKRLKGRVIDPKTMPAGFLIPLLDACGDSEDETLQELWAGLLAGAATNADNQSPIFIRVLRDLSADDAKWFLDASTRPDPLESVRSSDSESFRIEHVERRLEVVGLLSIDHIYHLDEPLFELRKEVSQFGRLFLSAVSHSPPAK